MLFLWCQSNTKQANTTMPTVPLTPERIIEVLKQHIVAGVPNAAAALKHLQDAKREEKQNAVIERLRTH